MVNDTEPRYRLVDANGNVVGSFFAEADGTLKLQEGTSGNDNELSLDPDGTVAAPQTTTGPINYQGGGFTQEGQRSASLALGETFNISTNFSNTNFGLGIITRGFAIGTALFEFERFAPTVDLVYDSQGKFTTTQGNGGTTNIFFNNSNELVAENENTEDDNFRIVLFSD